MTNSKQQKTTFALSPLCTMIFFMCIFLTSNAFACHHEEPMAFLSPSNSALTTFMNKQRAAISYDLFSSDDIRLISDSIYYGFNGLHYADIAQRNTNTLSGKVWTDNVHFSSLKHVCCDGQCNCAWGMCGHFAVIPRIVILSIPRSQFLRSSTIIHYSLCICITTT